MTKRLITFLAIATSAVLVQQQLLLRRPPRLIEIKTQLIQSGRAALDLRFSRPMDRQDLAERTAVKPEVSHRWLGENNKLRLIIEETISSNTPIGIDLNGTDQRGIQFRQQRWWWDPRPWLLVVRDLHNGQQVQLLDRAGEWRPLSPIWPQITNLVPLGNGQGIAMVSSDDSGRERIWLRRLRTSNLNREFSAIQAPQPLQLESLSEQPVLFGHLSSNLQGDLLVQSGGLQPDSERVTLIRQDGSKRSLDVSTSGPISLLPPGGGMVVPSYDSLNLRALVNNKQRQQALPGSRELGAFCPASGRAILIRHWPDYRRSIELVIPGIAPKQLWLGTQAVLGVACNGNGDHIWAVLGRWQRNRGEHEIILINAEGKILKRNNLSPWSIKGGTPIQFDSVSNRLLLTVIKNGESSSQVGMMDATHLRWKEQLSTNIVEAQWLSP